MPESTSPSAAGKPDETAGDATLDDAAVDDAAAQAEETDVPLNRAERRAKGKHKTPANLTVNKINPGKTNQAHAQRNFSSRRSGG